MCEARVRVVKMATIHGAFFLGKPANSNTQLGSIPNIADNVNTPLRRAEPTANKNLGGQSESFVPGVGSNIGRKRAPIRGETEIRRLSTSLLQDRVAIQFHSQSLEGRKKSPIYSSVFSFTNGAPSICPSAFLHLCTSKDALFQKWPQRREIGTSERRNGKRMPFESMCGKGPSMSEVKKISTSLSHMYLHFLLPCPRDMYDFQKQK